MDGDKLLTKYDPPICMKDGEQVCKEENLEALHRGQKDDFTKPKSKQSFDSNMSCRQHQNEPNQSTGQFNTMGMMTMTKISIGQAWEEIGPACAV
jgi:hypothetical protein